MEGVLRQDNAESSDRFAEHCGGYSGVREGRELTVGEWADCCCSGGAGADGDAGGSAGFADAVEGCGTADVVAVAAAIANPSSVWRDVELHND